MNELTKLIKCDMRPALGVTEPGAIAFATSVARRHAKGKLISVELYLNSGMFKNAFTCGIPNSMEVGNAHAAALGAVAADPDKALECLSNISKEQAIEAKDLVDRGLIHVKMSEISSRIFIKAIVSTDEAKAEVIIKDFHTNIVSISENGKIVFEKKERKEEEEEELPLIHRYTLSEMLEYVTNVPLEEIDFIKSAFDLNFALSKAGIESERGIISKYLLKENGGLLISSDEEKTAALLSASAIEARVLGLPLAAMSITGSGAHGIIATMPLFASYRVRGFSLEMLLRATALSYLICMYIKEYSGKLSAFCGCAIAAGTGSASALTYLDGGGIEEISSTIRNMASSITGMICDGGNHGCALKGITAVDSAYRAYRMGINHVSIDAMHGINGLSAEETMRFMGMIASPGMTGTEKTILDILETKQLEQENGKK